ncbi:hypothetical protein F4782DRAFT_534779 [Xylaria castorea]|nr:hypothetical protein F4782DRAFT_534779 [Xylaria castorea]
MWHQGPNAFHRVDHLAQHIRHKHRSYGPAEAESQEQALIHVQRMPDLPDLPLLPFSCTEPGCSRWGQDGFVRQVDSDEHMMVHTLLQGSMPSQPGSADPDSFPMNNAFDQGQGYNFQQGMIFQPAVSFSGDGGYGMNLPGQQENEGIGSDV